eukprot:12909040-Prorocentrum_lima.AAC.1
MEEDAVPEESPTSSPAAAGPARVPAAAGPAEVLAPAPAAAQANQRGQATSRSRRGSLRRGRPLGLRQDVLRTLG